MPTGHGIYVKKLTEFVSSVLNDGGTVVARRLRRPKKGARGALRDDNAVNGEQAADESWLSHLDSLYMTVAPLVPTGSPCQEINTSMVLSRRFLNTRWFTRAACLLRYAGNSALFRGA